MTEKIDVFSGRTVNIVSIDISPRKVAYMGNTTPGYLTVRLKTAVPTRGEILVTGAQNTKIVLSADDYKTEHVVNWVPFNDQTKQPLPPGQYALKLNLYAQNGESSLGIPQGDVVVVHETNPKPLIENITVNPTVIQSIPANPNEKVLTMTFTVNRHAEVYSSISNPWNQRYKSAPVKLEPGTYSWTWNGRDNNGNPMTPYEYIVCFYGRELNFNNPKDHPEFSFCSKKFLISYKTQSIPESRFREVIQDITLKTPAVSPDGDGLMDMLEGTITLREKADIALNIVDEMEDYVVRVLETGVKEPGVYPFSWDGIRNGEMAANGKYYLQVYLTEENKAQAMTYKDKSFRIVNSIELKPVQPLQNVKVTADYSLMSMLSSGGLMTYKGAVYPLLDYNIQQYGGGSYKIMLAEGVLGYIKVQDVEWMDLDKLPKRWLKVTSQAAEITDTPYYGYQILTYLGQGNIVRMINKEEEWYRILLDSGKQGYIKAADVVEVSSPDTQPPPKPDTTTYTVVSGDTLWKIAQKHGVTVNEIAAANQIDPNQYLVIGQKLIIPQKPAPVPGSPAFAKIYYVLPGDSLWRISQTYNVTIQDILTVNRLSVNSPLWVNQKLMIPGVYQVLAGDSLWKIAQKHNTTVQKLVQWNGMDMNAPLWIGQKILIGL